MINIQLQRGCLGTGGQERTYNYTHILLSFNTLSNVLWQRICLIGTIVSSRTKLLIRATCVSMVLPQPGSVYAATTFILIWVACMAIRTIEVFRTSCCWTPCLGPWSWCSWDLYRCLWPCNHQLFYLFLSYSFILFVGYAWNSNLSLLL